MNYYDEIKRELINNEVYKRVKDYSKNRSDLNTYYKVGKLIVEAQGGEMRAKYGDNLIKEYSKKLTLELGRGYTITNLKYMRQFYLFCEKSHAVRDQLSWSHYRELMFMNDINKINYYIKISIQQNLSYRQLHERIKSNEYERLDEQTKERINNKTEAKITDFIKNPILVKNIHNYQEISEKLLKQLILEDLGYFMKELGDGFCYVDNEYKIKLGDRYNYIDLLLFNIEYNGYVVVELKVTELKKEHIGQIEIYMNYINENLKKVTQNKTIGIIICKQDNKYIISYCSDNRIIAREYKLV